MPTRPRSHRLEDISRTRFRSVVPAEWVVRDKPDNDYGIDQEVEIFLDDGSSTGLTFNVQLKATDNISLKDKVSISTDSLKYLASHDSPSMISRYCAGTDTIYWMWITDAIQSINNPNNKSVTLTFTNSNLWSTDTGRQIPRTLQVLRTIRLASRDLGIGLTLNSEKIPYDLLFPLRRSVATLVRNVHLLSESDSALDFLPVSISIEDNFLVLSIDRIASLSFELGSDPDNLGSLLSYGLAFMAARYDFSAQSLALLRHISSSGYRAPSRELGAQAAYAALPDPHLASEIAALNEIHIIQDSAYLLYLNGLLATAAPTPAKTEAIRRFYGNAIDSHLDDPKRLAAIYYSYANHLSNSQDYARAFRFFNLARKSWNEYCNRDYYLNEVGGLLYFSGHFRESARSYNLSLNITDSLRTRICLGDALLYSGEVELARIQFDIIQNHNEADRGTAMEASLKVWMCTNIAYPPEFDGIDFRKRVYDLPYWSSRYKICMETGAYDDALAAALTVAFRFESSIEAWCAALRAAAIFAQSGLLIEVISSAILRTGYEAYNMFRDEIVQAGADKDWVSNLDEIIQDLYSAQPPTLPPLTIRDVGI